MIIEENTIPFDKIKGKLLMPVEYGDREYGQCYYGGFGDLSGIYQIRHQRTHYLTLGEKETGALYIRKSILYWPTNNQTEDQQAWRTIFRAGVLAWQNLTEQQKEIWRGKVLTLKMTGFNLYLSNYLFEHK